MTTEQFLDFLSNNRFKEWVFEPDNAALNAFWTQWLLENPDKKAEIETFKGLMLQINKPDSSLSDPAEKGLWDDIQHSISESEAEERDVKIRPLVKKWWALAATIVGLIVSFLYFFTANRSFDKLNTIQTAYGETRTLGLPDGSQVILNANSAVSFTDKWPLGKDRQITLKGEAYFIVNEQGTATHRDRFIVHTPELDVEVLGTRFNVNTYRPQTQVVLQKGSVEIVTKGNQVEKKYNMTPGQSAIFDKQRDVVNISAVNSDVYVGWKDNHFIFDNTPLSEVAIMLEHTYGLKVIIRDKELAAKKISGEIPTSERKSLLLALSTLYSLKMMEQGRDSLVISQ
jgi:transmembrane sensor